MPLVLGNTRRRRHLRRPPTLDMVLEMRVPRIRERTWLLSPDALILRVQEKGCAHSPQPTGWCQSGALVMLAVPAR